MKRLFTNLLVYIADKINRKITYEKSQRHCRALGSCGKNVRFLSGTWISGHEYIIIGDNFVAGKNFRIEAIDTYCGRRYYPQISIGKNVALGDGCHLGCVNGISIGDNTLLASKVLITDHNHGFADSRDIDIPPTERELTTDPVSIGRNCWIGDGACILKGVTLGDNVIVGANSVVTHSFPENSIIGGVPAKLIRTLQ